MIRRFWINSTSNLVFGVMVVAAASVAFFRPAPVAAQFFCTGAACAALPFDQNELNNMMQEFKTQYTDTLFDDISEAATLANIAGPPIGTIRLNRFTVGGNFGVSYLRPYDVIVTIPGTANFEAIPSAGGAINPRIYFGANLGWLAGLFGASSENADGSSSPLSLRRFDVYISFMDMTQTFNDYQNFNGKLRASAYLRGAQVNYNLVEGKSFGPGPLFAFHGISLGLGAYSSRQALQFTQEEQNLGFNMDGFNLIWKASNRMDIDTKIDSYLLEAKTGFQFLYVFNLAFGGGIAANKGGTDFVLNRTGPVFANSDVLAAAGITIPDSVLTINIEGNGRVPKYVAFLKGSLGIHLTAFKLELEGIATQGTYAANLGARFEL